MVGQRGLEAHVGVGGDRQRGHQHHHAERALERGRGPRGGRQRGARRGSANSTTAEPSEYAIAIATLAPDAAPTEITAARIGPAQGA